MIVKPRVYIAIGFFYPLVGGSETQTLAQAQQLRKNGYTVQVVTFNHRYTWQTYEDVQGIPVLRVARSLLGRRNRLPIPLQKLLYLLALFVMAWTLWTHRKHYDILQVCQINTLVPLLAVVCWLAKKPMTLVAISAGADKATKGNVEAKLLAGPLDPATPWLHVGGRGWIDGDLYNLQRAGKPVVDFTKYMLTRIGAVVIVLSTRMRRYLEENNFAIPGMVVIPNGVDIQRFQPLPNGKRPENHQKTVICVCKLRYEKGIDVLLQAWRLVQLQNPDARLIVVGDGGLEQQLKHMAQALNIASTVEFAGLQRDVPTQYHRGAIAVLPSRWEGMPNALIEAMASGLACIATRVSGSEDLIQSGVNGLLIEPDDYPALAQKLLSLLDDPLAVAQYGKAARATIEQGFTLQTIMKMYEAVYQKLCL